MNNKTIFILLLGFVAITLLNTRIASGEGTMKITSPEFENNKTIPMKFSCMGKDINPALLIEGIPAEAKSLALIMDDPDAPRGTWVHWVVYDIPVIPASLQAGVVIEENSIPGKQGVNNSGKKNYGGPCPPSGVHRYFFKIYALDMNFDCEEGINKEELEKAMQGHILDKAEMVGLFGE